MTIVVVVVVVVGVGSQDPRVPGSQDPRVLGSQGPRNLVSQDPRILGSQDPRVLGSQYPRILVSQDPSILVSQDRSILVSQYRSILVSQYPSILVPQYPSILVSQYPTILVSQYPSILYTRDCLFDVFHLLYPSKSASLPRKEVGERYMQVREIEGTNFLPMGPLISRLGPSYVQNTDIYSYMFGIFSDFSQKPIPIKQASTPRAEIRERYRKVEERPICYMLNFEPKRVVDFRVVSKIRKQLNE